MAAVSLFILPESPRWLVVNGHLDMALAVIHRVFTRSVLPTGNRLVIHCSMVNACLLHTSAASWTSVTSDSPAWHVTDSHRLVNVSSQSIMETWCQAWLSGVNSHTYKTQASSSITAILGIACTFCLAYQTHGWQEVLCIQVC